MLYDDKLIQISVLEIASYIFRRRLFFFFGGGRGEWTFLKIHVRDCNSLVNINDDL